MTQILVTGTGAIIGYGILRTLRMGLPEACLIAADIHADAVGRHWADGFVQAPMTADAGYGNWLADVIESEAIDLIIPGIEQDVSYLAGIADAPPLDVRLALNNPSLIRLAGDKWALAEEMAERDLPGQIDTHISGSFAELADRLGLPFLMKPRHGYAGKGIVRVAAQSDFDPLIDRYGPELMAQRIVGTDDQEFTVSVFCDGDGAVNAGIALRRRLASDGSTEKASTVDMAPFRSHIEAYAQAFRPRGPTNFQFRMTDDGPMLLDINPRISSATSIRAAFGLNEAVMCVHHYLWNKTVRQPELRFGRAARYIEDCIEYEAGTDF